MLGKGSIRTGHPNSFVDGIGGEAEADAQRYVLVVVQLKGFLAVSTLFLTTEPFFARPPLAYFLRHFRMCSLLVALRADTLLGWPDRVPLGHVQRDEVRRPLTASCLYATSDIKLVRPD